MTLNIRENFVGFSHAAVNAQTAPLLEPSMIANYLRGLILPANFTKAQNVSTASIKKCGNLRSFSN
jgi:hypothetical protein